MQVRGVMTTERRASEENERRCTRASLREYLKKREFIFWGQKTKNAGGIEMQKFALWNGG